MIVAGIVPGRERQPLKLDGGWSEIEQQTRALEAAIDRIEKDFAQHAISLQCSVQSSLPQSEEGSGSLPSSPSTTPKTSTFGDEGMPAHCLFVRLPTAAQLYRWLLAPKIDSQTLFLGGICDPHFGGTLS